MRLDEEKLEFEVGRIIELCAYYLQLFFQQIGKLIELISFNLHRESNEENSFEFGRYYLVGLALIVIGFFLILSSATLFPTFDIAILFFCLILIGLFLYLT